MEFGKWFSSSAATTIFFSEDMLLEREKTAFLAFLA